MTSEALNHGAAGGIIGSNVGGAHNAVFISCAKLSQLLNKQLGRSQPCQALLSIWLLKVR